MTDFSDAAILREATAFWWAFVPPLALQATVTLLAAAAIDAVLPRRAWPELRAALWVVALARLIVPAEVLSVWQAASLALPYWPRSIDTVAFASADAESAAIAGAETAFLVWATGAAAFVAIGVFHYAALARSLRARARAAWPSGLQARFDAAAGRAGLARTPQVLSAPAVRSPCVVGILRPLVLLPAHVETRYSPEQLDHVLLHEFTHVKHRDALWDALVCALTAVYWFHPLVWIAGFRLAALREQCCDRAVVRRLDGDARAYRDTLLDVALRLVEQPRPRVHGFISPRSQLLARLRLLERARPERARARLVTTGLVAVVLFAAFVPVAPFSGAAVAEVGALLERPPGCLLLRYEIYRRLAAERAGADAAPSEAHSPPPGESP